MQEILKDLRLLPSFTGGGAVQLIKDLRALPAFFPVPSGSNIPPPGVPAGLSATPGDTTVELTWDAVDGATGYNVYRDSVRISTNYGDNVFDDSGLTNGTTYSYTVSAVNAAGESAQCDAVEVTPRYADPGSDTADTTGWTADSDIRSADGGTYAPPPAPTDLEGLVFWASNTGSSNSPWPDIGGASNDLVQATADNQASVVPDVINGIQGRLFDGVNDFYTFTSNIPMGSAWTVVALVKCLGAAGHGDKQCITGNVSDVGIFLDSGGTSVIVEKSFEATLATSSTITANALHIISVVYDSPDCSIYVDGALVGTGSSAQTFTVSSKVGQGGFGSYSFNGYQFELAFYNRALPHTFAELSGLEHYFAAEYDHILAS